MKTIVIDGIEYELVKTSREEICAADHTGLIWQLKKQGPMSWHNAMGYAKALSGKCFEGFSNWRLPTDKELENLIDRSKSGPAMRDDTPWKDSMCYWSSTTRVGDTDYAWYVNFNSGFVSSSKTGHYYVRCVREPVKQ